MDKKLIFIISVLFICLSLGSINSQVVDQHGIAITQVSDGQNADPYGIRIRPLHNITINNFGMASGTTGVTACGITDNSGNQLINGTVSGKNCALDYNLTKGNNYYLWVANPGGTFNHRYSNELTQHSSQLGYNINFTGAIASNGGDGWDPAFQPTETGNYRLSDIINVTTTNNTITDLTSPNGTLLTPLNGTITDIIIQNLTVNVSDNMGLSNITLNIWNQTSLINQTTINVSGTQAVKGIIYTFLYDGEFKWFYEIRDLNNNIFVTNNNTLTINTNIPAYPLNITLIYPLNTSTILSSLVNFTWNVSSINISSVTSNTNTYGFYNQSPEEDQYASPYGIWFKALKNLTVKSFGFGIGTKNFQFCFIGTNSSASTFIQLANGTNTTTSCDFNPGVNIIAGRYYAVGLGTTNRNLDQERWNYNGSAPGTYMSPNTEINITGGLYSNGGKWDVGNPNPFPPYTTWAFGVSSITTISADIYGSGLKNTTIYVYNQTNLINKTTISSSNLVFEKYLYPILLSQGNYTWFTDAYNFGGNRTISENQSFQINLEKSINIFYPLNNTNYSYKPTTMNYTFSGLNANCWYSLNLGVTNFSTTCGNPIIGLTSNEGYNYWRIYGNNSLDTISNTTTFFVDSEYPLISILSPSNNTKSTGNNITVNVSAYDLTERNITFYLYNRSINLVQTASYSNGTRNHTFLGLSDDYYYFDVTIADMFGKTNTTLRYKYTLDNLAPQGTSGGITTPSFPSGGGTTPINNSYTNVANQNFTVNASDILNGSGAGISNATLVIKNQTDDIIHSETIDTGGQPNIFLGLAYLLWYEGIYKFYYSLYDVVGNFFNTVEAVITYDTIAPSGYILYPLNTTYNTNVTNLNFTISEVNPLNCWYSLNLGVTNVSTNCSQNVTGLNANEGSNAWRIYLNDSAGNLNYSTVYFVKDTTAPIITIHSPIPYYIYNSTSVLLNITTDESATIIYSTSYVNNSVYTIPLYISLPIGLQTIVINATDSYSNSISTNITVGVDLTPPDIIFTPIANASTDSFPKNITINYTIENYNISSCWYQEGDYIQNNFTDGLTSLDMTYPSSYFGNYSYGFGSGSAEAPPFEYCVKMISQRSGRLNITWSSSSGYGTGLLQWKNPATIVIRDSNQTILEELPDFDKDYTVQSERVYPKDTEFGFCLRAKDQNGTTVAFYNTVPFGTWRGYYVYGNPLLNDRYPQISLTVNTPPETKLLRVPQGESLDEGFITLTGTTNATYTNTPTDVYLTIGDNTFYNNPTPDWYKTYYQAEETAYSTSESATGYFNLGKEYDGNWSSYLYGIGSLVQTYTASVKENYIIPNWYNRSVWEFKYSLFDNSSACIGEYFNVYCYNGTGNQLIFSQNSGDNVLGDKLVKTSIPDSCNVSGRINITTETSTGQGIGGDCILRYYEGRIKFWNSTNPFNSTVTTNNLAVPINNYLNTCNYTDGYCYVPLNFWSNGGILQLSNILFDDGAFGTIPCPSGSAYYQNQSIIPFWIDGSHTITIYVKDTAYLLNSASQSFFLQYHQYAQSTNSSIVVEGQDVTYTLEVNMTLPTNTNATLVWNGVSYPAQTYTLSGNKSTFTVVLPIPTGIGNLTGVPVNWYWEYDIKGYMINEGVYSTSTQTQIVYKLTIDDCSTFTDRILHFDLNDEATDSLMNSSYSPIIEVGITLSNRLDNTVKFVYNNTFYNNSVSLCLPEYVLNSTSYRIDAVASYIASNYVQEFWYIDNGLLQKNNSYLDIWTQKNVTLRDLLTTDSTTFLFRFFDEDYIKQPNAIVTVLRDYIGNGAFKEVERAKMDDNGETHVHLVQEDVIYKFRITLDGVLLYDSSTYNAKCLEQPCVISLQATQESQQYNTDPYQLETGTYKFNILSSNRTVEVAYNLNSTADMELVVYEYNYDTNQQVEVGSDSQTAQTGVLAVSVPVSVGNKTYLAKLRYNGEAVTTEYLELNEKGSTYFGTLGLLIAGILILTLGLIAISQGGWTILFLLIGVIISVIAGFLDMSIYLLMWLISTGAILIWKLAGRRSI